MLNPKADALRLLSELRADLDKLIQVHNSYCQAAESLAAAAGGGSGQRQMMDATKQMQQMNQSFNLQYLQLQQKMQADNRQFTLMSNIMKTKHDTAKNAINNIR